MYCTSEVGWFSMQMFRTDYPHFSCPDFFSILLDGRSFCVHNTSIMILQWNFLTLWLNVFFFLFDKNCSIFYKAQCLYLMMYRLYFMKHRLFIFLFWGGWGNLQSYLWWSTIYILCNYSTFYIIFCESLSYTGIKKSSFERNFVYLGILKT